jgi:Domain of unknown function (DUF5658)
MQTFMLPLGNQRDVDNASRFGDLVIVLFIAMQVFDGALTYVGIRSFGRGIEANPLLVWLMQRVGDGPGLAMAKSVALGFGAFLHLTSVHRVIAALVGIYLAAAIIPWLHILLGPGW